MDGANMGAATGVCEATGVREHLVRLGPGSFRIDGLSLAHHVSLEGAGADSTVIQGTVVGLRTGAALSRVTVTGATHGGVRIPSDEAPEILDCTIHDNAASGVVCGEGSAPQWTRCTISGNSSSWGEAGGGVTCGRASTPAFIDCEISDNSAQGAGGVFSLEASPTFTRCTIVRNRAVRGAGLRIQGGASPRLTECTIAWNRAESTGGGAHSESGSLDLQRCTIAANRARFGGGLYLTGAGTPTIKGCVISENTQGGAVCVASSPDGVIDFSSTVELEVGGETYDLPDYVIEPPDYHLRPGSPLIGAGNLAGAPENDLDENSRPCGDSTHTAIGAYEFCGPAPEAPRFVRGDCNGDGAVAGQVTDALFLLEFNFFGRAAPPCLAACDADADGRVLGAVTDAIYLLSFNFAGGAPPPAPFPECGPGRGADIVLGCEQEPAGCAE